MKRATTTLRPADRVKTHAAPGQCTSSLPTWRLLAPYSAESLAKMWYGVLQQHPRSAPRPSRAAVASQDSSGRPQQSITSPSTERSQASTGALAAHSAGVAFVTIGCLLAGDATSATSSSALARQSGGQSATTMPTGGRPRCCEVRGHARPRRRPGPALTCSPRWRADPDDNERCQKHPAGGEREPRRHHRVPGDDVAGVAIARKRRGSADDGQSGSGEKSLVRSVPTARACPSGVASPLRVVGVLETTWGEDYKPVPCTLGTCRQRATIDQVSPSTHCESRIQIIGREDVDNFYKPAVPPAARPSLIGGDVHADPPL